MSSPSVSRLRQRPWRGVAAGTAAVFCVALAYVAGRVEGGAAPAPAPAAADAVQAEQPPAADGFGDGFQAPPDATQGDPPTTQAS